MEQHNLSEEQILVNKRKLDMILSKANFSVFEYFVNTKTIKHDVSQTIDGSNLGKKFNLPDVIENGVEYLINCGVLHENSTSKVRELFAKIDNGESEAKESVLMIDICGREVFCEIFLSSVYDKDGKQDYAIGILSDISEKKWLLTEKRYVESLTSGKIMSYEANISKNLVIFFDKEWGKNARLESVSSYEDMISHVATYTVHPDFRDKYLQYTSANNIMEVLKNGQLRTSMQYRKLKDSEYIWVQNSMNIILDDNSHDVKIRCYVENIDIQKKLEIKEHNEQIYYENMATKAAKVYEVSLSTNSFIKGNDEWAYLYGLKNIYDYNQSISEYAKVAVHYSDADVFRSNFSLENCLANYKNGINEIRCEYRKLNRKDGVYTWVETSMHLYENQFNEIKAYCYVSDINQEKQDRIELEYKSEHDLLTDLFNKGTAEAKIEEYLLSDNGKKGSHALFIFDIDRFKIINDTFGHVFGDMVLAQIASKAKQLFRDDDIVGRVGGDEFMVLMKNIPKSISVVNKAKEMCKVFCEDYTQNGVKYLVSASIGVAIYENFSDSFLHLYRHADSALYRAKNNGRNQFCLYDSSMEAFVSAKNMIDINELVEKKSFEKNISEYIFRLLYDSNDKASSINSALELVGKQYGVSRAYIFEESRDGDSINNTFEWCNEGVTSQKQMLQNVSYQELGDYKKNFNNMGIFFLSDLNNVMKGVKELLEPQGIKSMLQFSITKNEEFFGFIGFDQCEYSRIPSKSEITELLNIANILGVFLVEMRTISHSLETKKLALSIVNALDSYAYVIDRDTHKLLFVNDKTLTVLPNAKIGNICYNDLWNKDEPCPSCPMAGLTIGEAGKCSLELCNPHVGVWTRATASWIDWLDGKKACLVDSVDITQYKK